MTGELFTRKEVATIFNVTTRAIWYWEKKGILKPAGYVAGRPRYAIEDIENVSTTTNKKS